MKLRSILCLLHFWEIEYVEDTFWSGIVCGKCGW